MTVSNLTNVLGVAQTTVGKDHSLVESIRYQAEDANARCRLLKKSMIHSF